MIQSYPDREYTELREAIAAYCGARTEDVITGNGSTELISLALRSLAPKRVLILGPTYSEYERETRLCGGTSEYFPLHEADSFRPDAEALSAHLDAQFDLLVICNPNNPTSTALSKDEMRTILAACKKLGIFVMVDETYVEFAKEADKISSVPLIYEYDNLLVLRGTSKFFAAPGLRLGYALSANKTLAEQIRSLQNPWSISSLAELAGRLMFSDADYIEKTRALIDTERSRMYEAFSSMDGFTPFFPLANFMLVRIDRSGLDAAKLFSHCIKQGLMIRNCASFPFLDERFFRFCFMLPEQNDRLVEAISSVL